MLDSSDDFLMHLNFLGDIFFVHNDLGDGWLWVTGHRTGEQGLVFKVKLLYFCLTGII